MEDEQIQAPAIESQRKRYERHSSTSQVNYQEAVLSEDEATESADEEEKEERDIEGK